MLADSIGPVQFSVSRQFQNQNDGKIKTCLLSVRVSVCVRAGDEPLRSPSRSLKLYNH